jgi:pentatricopeptide repeat protein
MILKAIKFNGQCLCDKITIGLIEYLEEKDLPLHFSGLDYSHHKNTSLQTCRLDYIKLAITYNHKCCNGNLHYWVNSLCKMNEENDIVYLLDTNFPDGQIKFDNISGEGLLIYACMNKMTRLIPKIIDYNPNEYIKINYGSAPEQIIIETALNSCIKNRLIETAIYLVDKMEKSVIELWDREGAGRHNSLTLTMQFIPSDNPLKEILVEKLLNC